MKKKLTVLSCSLFPLLSYAIEPVDFAKEIWPMLKDSCVKCHGPDYKDKRGRMKKAKAGLRLDSKKAILEGSKEGKVFVAGNADESSLYNLTILPEDHDDVMPPKGDLLTKEQTELLKRWINEGAKFGKWTMSEELKNKVKK